MAKGPQSARGVFTEMLRDYAESHPDLSTREVAEAVARMFVTSKDPTLLEDYFVHEGLTILTWTLRTDHIRTRHGVYSIISIPNGQESEKPKKKTPKRSKSIYEKITRWREFDPDLNRSRPLLTFNKTGIVRSAQWDRATMIHHAWKIDWKMELAEGLPDDEVTVGDFYTPDQVLDALEKSKRMIATEIKSGGLRIKVEPLAMRQARTSPSTPSAPV